jgi:hypothetical protein
MARSATPLRLLDQATRAIDMAGLDLFSMEHGGAVVWSYRSVMNSRY